VDKCSERDGERRGATQKEERKLDWNKKIQLLGYSNMACKVGVTADAMTRFPCGNFFLTFLEKFVCFSEFREKLV
jgi:hypothetical protein